MPEGIPQRGIRGEPACRERTSRKHRDWLVFCARGEAGAFAQAGLNPQIPDRRVWFQEFRTDGPAFITLLKERGKAQVGERSTKEATETEFPRMAAVVFHMEQHDPVNGTYPTILLEGWEC
jgi:hypothetical protein